MYMRTLNFLSTISTQCWRKWNVAYSELVCNCCSRQVKMRRCALSNCGSHTGRSGWRVGVLRQGRVLSDVICACDLLLCAGAFLITLAITCMLCEAALRAALAVHCFIGIVDPLPGCMQPVAPN